MPNKYLFVDSANLPTNGNILVADSGEITSVAYEAPATAVANADSSVVLTREGINLSTTTSVTNVTATSFGINRDGTISGTETIHWQALGLRP